MTATYFGLPEEVKFCKKCVYSNQRPLSTDEYSHQASTKKETLDFDEQGVCLACRQMDEVFETINWKEREEELFQFLEKYRSKDGSYDVLVPGSGGKDSCMAAHLLKYKFGMHPLTVTWAPHLYTDIGFQNFQNWMHVGGFDNYLFTPNGRIHRKLTRLAYENLLHPFQPFILGQKTFAPKMAKQFGINLVFYGEMPGQYGERISTKVKKFGDSDQGTGFKLKYGDPNNLMLGGVSVKELKEKHEMTDHDLAPYIPMDPSLIQKAGVEFHYLGYYVKWVPQEAYYYAVEHCGFKTNPERTEGTYSKYNSIDDKIDPYHYWTTFIKFGIGRTTYDASQEVRNKHLTREEAVALVHKFDGEFPKRYYKEILEYMNLTDEEFHRIANQFRSPHLWENKNGEWQLRHRVS